MNWRKMVYSMALEVVDAVDFMSAASIHSAGTLTGPPEMKPFMIISLRDSDTQISPGVAHRQELWLLVHDEPGTLTRIDEVLEAIHSLFDQGDSGLFPWPSVDPRTGDPWDAALGAEHAIGARFNGDSREQGDDYYGTIMRYASYDLIGSGS